MANAEDWTTRIAVIGASSAVSLGDTAVATAKEIVAAIVARTSTFQSDRPRRSAFIWPMKSNRVVVSWLGMQS